MVDLSQEMSQLWTALGAPSLGGPKAIQFVAATTGEGASTVAREFAFFASRRARRGVWLVDVDLMNAPQHRAVAADPGRYGLLGRQSAASPDGSAFFTVQPPTRAPDGQPWPDGRFLAAHPVGGSKLWVTRFRREALSADQAPHILPTEAYWAALKRFAELIVVDSPAPDRAASAVTLAPCMDSTVIVVAADSPDTDAPAALRDAIAKAGGRCAGLVFNRASAEAPAFLRGLMP
ncbi:MAG TPA: sugar kinase [Caulobacteraceae bacterium]|nr:sugar kinase [Caulobacteraceae bacterium]